jgi:2-haloacid dehalogenase
LLRALRTAGVPVYALTNFGIQTFDVAEPVYPFLGEFERRYISGHMGVIKPDADIYAQLEADVPEQPDTLLFADDRQENLDAAAARGWHTHLFDHPAGWADRLVAEGLLTQEQAQ